MDYDPDYVADMNKPDFDPHCDIALEAAIMDVNEVKAYKWMDKHNKDVCKGANGVVYYKKVLSLKRHSGKTTNYASTYGAGGPTIARAAKVPEAVGNKLWEAYWARNWSIKSIAEACITKQCKGLKWLWNPVAKMWYYLKKEKDRFSTLNQGTGSYCFDIWLQEILKLDPDTKFVAQFHDEIIISIKKGMRDYYSKLLTDAVDNANIVLGMKRDLGVGIDFGGNYSEIH